MLNGCTTAPHLQSRTRTVPRSLGRRAFRDDLHAPAPERKVFRRRHRGRSPQRRGAVRWGGAHRRDMEDPARRCIFSGVRVVSPRPVPPMFLAAPGCPLAVFDLWLLYRRESFLRNHLLPHGQSSARLGGRLRRGMLV